METVAAHYAVGGIERRILDAIARAGIALQDVTVDDLSPVDEFHIGGRAATEALLEAAQLRPTSRVLDVGSGLGGTARYLALRGHRVMGVDLTEEYAVVARALTRLLRLEDRVCFVRASVVDLPFADQTFDAAVQLHVGMNVPDKAELFREVARVLRPGGTVALYDVMGPPDAGIDFPVPWASAPAHSHLATPKSYVQRLEEAGFRIVHLRNRRAFAVGFFSALLGRSGPPPALGLHLVMGPEASTKVSNVARAVERGTVSPVEIVAVRPDGEA